MRMIYCTFKRTEIADREEGVFIEAEHDIIVDMTGRVVEAPVWNYTQRPHKFCVECQ